MTTHQNDPSESLNRTSTKDDKGNDDQVTKLNTTTRFDENATRNYYNQLRKNKLLQNITDITQSTRELTQNVTCFVNDVITLVQDVSNSTGENISFVENAEEIAADARLLSETAHLIAQNLRSLDIDVEPSYEELRNLNVDFTRFGTDSLDFSIAISSYFKNYSNQSEPIANFSTKVYKLSYDMNSLSNQVYMLSDVNGVGVGVGSSNSNSNSASKPVPVLSEEDSIKLAGEAAALSSGSEELFQTTATLSENAAMLYERAQTLYSNVVNPSGDISKIQNDARIVSENASHISNYAAQLGTLSEAIAEDSKNPNANMFRLLMNTARLAITALTVSSDADIFSVETMKLSDFAAGVSSTSTDQFQQQSALTGRRRLLGYNSGSVSDYIQQISVDAGKLAQQATDLAENARNISDSALNTKDTASGDSGDESATVEPPPDAMLIDPDADPLLSPYQFGVSLASCYGLVTYSGKYKYFLIV